MTIQKDFRVWQRSHPNFMTPHIESLVKVNENIIIEVSSGRDASAALFKGTLYGVSVFRREGSSFKVVKGYAFRNRATAMKQARKWAKEYKG